MNRNFISATDEMDVRGERKERFENIHNIGSNEGYSTCRRVWWCKKCNLSLR